MKRNPFNWVGNKYKHMDRINKLVIGNKYNSIYDVFMGSGNILVNLDCSAAHFIGNDIIPLLPNVYKSMKKDFKLEEIESIINRWNRFSDKTDYYAFRDYWNTKYLSNNYDKEFVIETILLLKMCSNSMVRFNRKEGYFNQGFRGLGGGKLEFFSPLAKSKILKSLNDFGVELNKSDYIFKNQDFKEILKLVNKDDLVILDPPYILSEGMYGTDFSVADDNHILSFLKSTKADFILFNYLSSGDRINQTLVDFIDDTMVVDVISNKDFTGQGRASDKTIEEVMISRIAKNKIKIV